MDWVWWSRRRDAFLEVGISDSYNDRKAHALDDYLSSCRLELKSCTADTTSGVFVALL